MNSKNENEVQAESRPTEETTRPRARTSDIIPNNLPTNETEHRAFLNSRITRAIGKALSILAFALFALFADRVSATTLSVQLKDIQMANLPNDKASVTFTPTNIVLLTSNGLSVGPPLTFNITNGLRTNIVLEPGKYSVKFPLVPTRLPFDITVFETNGVQNITNFLSNPAVFTWTNNFNALTRASEGDAAPGTLDEKIVAGDGITITPTGDTLVISAPGGVTNAATTDYVDAADAGLEADKLDKTNGVARGVSTFISADGVVTNQLNPDLIHAASFANGNATISADGTVALDTDLVNKDWLDTAIAAQGTTLTNTFATQSALANQGTAQTNHTLAMGTSLTNVLNTKQTGSTALSNLVSQTATPLNLASATNLPISGVTGLTATNALLQASKLDKTNGTGSGLFTFNTPTFVYEATGRGEHSIATVVADYAGNGSALGGMPTRGPDIWDNQPVPFIGWRVPGGTLTNQLMAQTNIAQFVLRGVTNIQAFTNLLPRVQPMVWLDTGFLGPHRDASGNLIVTNFPSGITNYVTNLHAKGFKVWGSEYFWGQPITAGNTEVDGDQNGSTVFNYPNEANPLGTNYIHPLITFETVRKDVNRFYQWDFDALIIQDCEGSGLRGYEQQRSRMFAEAVIYPNPAPASYTWKAHFPNRTNAMGIGHFKNFPDTQATAEFAYDNNTLTHDQMLTVLSTSGAANAIALTSIFAPMIAVKNGARILFDDFFANSSVWGLEDVKAQMGMVAVCRGNSVWQSNDSNNLWPTNHVLTVISNKTFVDIWTDRENNGGKRIIDNGVTNCAWARVLSDPNKIAVWFANSGASNNLTATWEMLGVTRTNSIARVFDVWTQGYIGKATNSYTANVDTNRSVFVILDFTPPAVFSAVKLSNTTNATTTLTADPELVISGLISNRLYLVEGQLFFDSADSGPGFNYGLSIPATMDIGTLWVSHNSGLTTWVSLQYKYGGWPSDGASGIDAVNTGIATEFTANFKIVFRSSSSGSAQITWARFSATGASLVLNKGSYMTARELP